MEASKKSTIIALSLLLLFCISPVGPSGAEDLTIKLSSKDTWKVLTEGGQQVATLRAAEDNAYSVQLMSGEYMGFILRDGSLKKPQRHPRISPDEARLYLDIWAAIQKMK